MVLIGIASWVVSLLGRWIRLVAPARDTRSRRMGAATCLRIGLLAATALLLAACGTTNCGPCNGGVRLSITGVGTDPTGVVQLCLDPGTCEQLRISPYRRPNEPEQSTIYLCTAPDPHYTACSVQGDTLTVDFIVLSVAPKQVQVTATDERSPDQHATGVFSYHQKDGPCDCDSRRAQVHLEPNP